MCFFRVDSSSRTDLWCESALAAKGVAEEDYLDSNLHEEDEKLVESTILY